MVENEKKLLHLGANLDPELVVRFRTQTKERKFKKLELIQRLAEWWLDLDPILQQQFYHNTGKLELAQTAHPQALAALEDEDAAAGDTAKKKRIRRRHAPKAG